METNGTVMALPLPLWMDVPSRERPAFAGMMGF